MADTQRQRGGHVCLQNTAQPLLGLYFILMFQFKSDLRSDLELFSREKCSKTPLDPTWLCTFSSFHSPLVSQATPFTERGRVWLVVTLQLLSFRQGTKLSNSG